MLIFRNKSTNQFDLKELNNINLGEIEAEDDKNLKNYFHWTVSSLGFFKSNCNYIVGTFGVGKSALFSAVSKKKILEKNEQVNKFFEEKYHVISITEELKIENSKEITFEEALIFWSSKLAIITMKNILKNFNSDEVKEVRNYLSLYDELKSEFNIQSIKNFFSDIKITPAFEYNGIKTSLEIQILDKTTSRELNFNEMFSVASDFFNKIDKECLLLVDRVDDYVRFQDINNKKIYLQALYEVVEEIRKNSNLRPLLFIREDLYKSLDFSTGYTKVNERTCFIEWTYEEILYLIYLRLVNNEYIHKKINEYFIQSSHKKNMINRFLEKFKKKFSKKTRNDSFLLEKTKEIIYLFINPEVLGEKRLFHEYLKEELEHGIAKNNPRIVLLFFKRLFKNQSAKNCFNLVNDKLVELKEVKGYKTYDLIERKTIESTIQEVKEISIENIKSSFKDKKYKEIFLELYMKQKSLLKENDYRSFLEAKSLIKEEIEFILKHLKDIGYLKDNYQPYGLYKKY